jgi:hypothetical protein
MHTVAELVMTTAGVDVKADKASVLKSSVEHIVFLIETLKNVEKRGVKLQLALPDISGFDAHYSDI